MPSMFCRAASGAVACAVFLAASFTAAEDDGPILRLPPSDRLLCVTVELPESPASTGAQEWQLVELGASGLRIPVQSAPGIAADGSPLGRCLLAAVPPGDDPRAPRQFRLEPAAPRTASVPAAMRIAEDGPQAIRLWEGSAPVLAYNFGTVIGEGVPASDGRRERSCYVHPLWGLGGEVLTDDFPRDHYHHHGVFWTWPYVEIAGQTYDLWMSTDIRQRFVRWLCREAGPVAAVIGVENGWFVGERQVMTERIWLRAFRSGPQERAIDLQLAFVAGEQSVQLTGSPGKSYGGLTVRFNVWPRRDAIVRVPGRELRHVGEGQLSAADLTETPLPWADLAARFPGSPGRSGAAVFIPPSHPDFPPTWLTRSYGPLCVGWPGVRPRAFAPGEAFRLDYRLWIHGQELDVPALTSAYESYVESRKLAW